MSIWNIIFAWDIVRALLFPLGNCFLRGKSFCKGFILYGIWTIREVDIILNPQPSQLNQERKELVEVTVDFKSGSRFLCPKCGHPDCEVYDTVKKSWRHVNSFQFPTYISARIPGVKYLACGKVTQSKVPWARERSSFSVYFEPFVATLAQVLPVATVAWILEETDTRLWRVLAHNVGQSVAKLDLSGVTQVGVDETSFRKGYLYVILFVCFSLEYMDILLSHKRIQDFVRTPLVQDAIPVSLDRFSKLGNGFQTAVAGPPVPLLEGIVCQVATLCKGLLQGQFDPLGTGCFKVILGTGQR